MKHHGLAVVVASASLAAALFSSCTATDGAAAADSEAGATAEGGRQDATVPDADAGPSALDASDAADACIACASGSCTTGGCDPAVFVTSQRFTGMIGDAGVASADDRCAELASAAGLGGTFMAWLSASDSQPPATRFSQKSSRPYRLLDGRRVAANFLALTSGTLETSISVTETRLDIGFAYVWTVTRRDGTRMRDAGDCRGWSSGDAGDVGYTGESDDAVPEWTEFADLPCSTSARLYCVEQRP